MKNIHILPTDKPSRLYLTTKEYVFDSKYSLSTDECQNKNIYITSDEDINENDYIITQDGRLVQVSYLLSKDLQGASKVVLTTDQDLIKDGVQEITDEFLEWFVKNPSCEYVEINNRFDYNRKSFVDHSGYKIIIPKEEPKKKHKVMIVGDGISKPKEETIEELKKWKQEALIAHEINQKVIEKLMAEKKLMYSEEEVLNFTQTMLMQYKFGNTNIEQLDLLKESLKQFKKKPI